MKLALAAAIAFVALPVLAAPAVPDGSYTCVLDGQVLGEIRLSGDQYQGVTRDGAFGDSDTYITMDPDRIEWLGTMGALDDAGYRVDHTVIRELNGKIGFTLTLLTPDQSASSTRRVTWYDATL